MYEITGDPIKCIYEGTSIQNEFSVEQVSEEPSSCAGAKGSYMECYRRLLAQDAKPLIQGLAIHEASPNPM
ncbi:hypothetical protein XELAEV_18046992mg [Xenopus laevis]|uniref:Uncharacterized protein n=1 Tax=Xenopus laevis TaxID=8355 RepID=A0A974BUM8_XENLA|nr:hypothetical protein XELAEV_18046992mg [Xenopus laevis]